MLKLATISAPTKLTGPAVVDINEVTQGNTESPVLTPQRRRCSPKARFEPYERNSKTVDENENRLLGNKTITGGTTTATPRPLDNVLVVVEEVSKL